MDVVIALLQLYVLLSLSIALASMLMHWLPVYYTLRKEEVDCFCTRWPKAFTLAYFITAFCTAPKLFFAVFDPAPYKYGLYIALKEQEAE